MNNEIRYVYKINSISVSQTQILLFLYSLINFELHIIVVNVLFNVQLKDISLICRRQRMPVKGFKCWSMFGIYGHCAVRVLSRANIYCDAGLRFLLSHPKNREPTWSQRDSNSQPHDQESSALPTFTHMQTSPNADEGLQMLA